MRVLLTERFIRDFAAAPPEVQKTFGKQLALLLRNRRHRSLDSKKHPASGPDVWQARVNDDWRFYFTITGNLYQLHKIIPHPK